MANGDDSGFYIFTIEFSTTVNVNEYIKITPPSVITISPTSEQCQGLTSNLAPILSCTISETSIYLRLFP